MNRGLLLMGIFVALCVGVIALPAQAIPTTIDFESLADSEAVTNQFPGLTFSNTTALTAGISLNDTDFPPHSGANVVFDDGGAIIIDFSPLAVDVTGFFTYTVPLSLTAFDEFSAPIGTAISSLSSNLGGFEMLSVAFAGGIARVIIEGDPSGSSFTLDDLGYTPQTVPEPSTSLLLATGLAGTLFLRRRTRYSLCRLFHIS